MKNILHRITLVAALLLGSNQDMEAQMPSGNVNPFSPAVLKVFGNQTNFSASTELRLSDGATTLEGASKMAVLDGKVRTEIDMSKMKSASVTPAMLGQMKQMGADQTVLIVRPDKGVTYMVYPTLKAYIEMPLAESDKQGSKKDPKITTTLVSKETIDGHPCVKNKVVITDEKGKSQEILVWNATDMKNFPAQMEMKENDATIVTKFKNVQFAKPDSKQFDPPAGYKKYAGIQELQQVMMQKMMGTSPK